MEFKKKTIIWEDNNEPPKDYIWAKKDGKFYEYSYATRSWVESKTISGGNSGESGGSGGGGGDEPTPTPSGIIGFPYQPKTVLGWVPQFIDDDYNPGYRINSDDVTILIEPILSENLEEYVNTRISESTEDVYITFVPIFEYDETMDIFARSSQDYYDNPPELYGGIPIIIDHSRSKNSTAIYSNVTLENWKGIYNGQEYIIAVPQSG